jgi:hypothetical protein
MNIFINLPKEIQINILDYVKENKIRDGKYVPQISKELKNNLYNNLTIIKRNKTCSYVHIGSFINKNEYKIYLSCANNIIYRVLSKRFYINDNYRYYLTINYHRIQ